LDELEKGLNVVRTWLKALKIGLNVVRPWSKRLNVGFNVVDPCLEELKKRFNVLGSCLEEMKMRRNVVCRREKLPKMTPTMSRRVCSATFPLPVTILVICSKIGLNLLRIDGCVVRNQECSVKYITYGVVTEWRSHNKNCRAGMPHPMP
jgi:hypothetical protein